MKGIISWYDIRKGFGFIHGEDGNYVFVHKSEVPFWTIFFRKGDKVEYTIEKTQRGNKATHIQMIE
ncbi:MAG: cold shock domain-containing protein [Candidatus Thermoplasmatota archaeon]